MIEQLAQGTGRASPARLLTINRIKCLIEEDCDCHHQIQPQGQNFSPCCVIGQEDAEREQITDEAQQSDHIRCQRHGHERDEPFPERLHQPVTNRILP